LLVKTFALRRRGTTRTQAPTSSTRPPVDRAVAGVRQVRSWLSCVVDNNSYSH